LAFDERPIGVSDQVSAQLVECVPPEPERIAVPLPEPPESSPVQNAQKATIGQTGADPPPQGVISHG